jgi:hypothetical protein
MCRLRCDHVITRRPDVAHPDAGAMKLRPYKATALSPITPLLADPMCHPDAGAMKLRPYMANAQPITRPSSLFTFYVAGKTHASPTARCEARCLYLCLLLYLTSRTHRNLVGL